MTDEDLVRKFKSLYCGVCYFQVCSECRYKSPFMKGYRCAEKDLLPVWHDLRKAPKELPKPNVQVLICLQVGKWAATYIAYYRPALCKWQAYNLHEAQRNCNEEDFIDADEVIAWCEIPRFEVEADSGVENS